MDVLRRQRRNYRDRPTVFVELEREPGSLRRLLETFRANEVIYLTGDPFSTLELEEWLQEPLPPGWRHGAHYLQLPHPVLRFEEPTDHGLWRVEIHRAAAYFGEGDYSPSDAMIAWHRLGALLAGSFDEGRLLATPATTGRYLIGRSIPFAREWPLLEVETQELLRSTSGQARVQMFGRTGPTRTLTEYDGRLMYGALCQRLPAGEPTRDTVDRFEGYGRQGRYRVRFAVPRDWDSRCECGAPGHKGIGLLGVRSETDSVWLWPAMPGFSGETWAQDVEVGIALAHGWRVQILERLLYPTPPYPAVQRRNGQISKAGPLDAWADHLVALRSRGGAPTLTAELIDHAVRNILLFGIGALHGSPRKVTHVVSLEDAKAGRIPKTARGVLPLGGELLIWHETEPSSWPAMSHPEWTTAIWGRARGRLLSAPAGRNNPKAGMLHVPAGDVVAARTDALWMTCDPGWADDGAVGRFRRVFDYHQGIGPWFQIPETEAALLRFRTQVRLNRGA